MIVDSHGSGRWGWGHARIAGLGHHNNEVNMVTPNIMGLSYVLSYRGLSYVPETPNIMDLSYVE